MPDLFPVGANPDALTRGQRARALLTFSDPRVGALWLAILSALFGVFPWVAQLVSPDWSARATYVGLSHAPWWLPALAFVLHAVYSFRAATMPDLTLACLRQIRLAASAGVFLWGYVLVCIPIAILFANGYMAPSAWAMYVGAFSFAAWTLYTTPPQLANSEPAEAPIARRAAVILAGLSMLAAGQPYVDGHDYGAPSYDLPAHSLEPPGSNELIYAIASSAATFATTWFLTRQRGKLQLNETTASQADFVAQWTRRQMDDQRADLVDLRGRCERETARLLSLQTWCIQNDLDLSAWPDPYPPGVEPSPTHNAGSYP
jgi:hypothetical protein